MLKRWAIRALAFALLAAVIHAAVSGDANAQTPACPAAPAAYEGTDPVVAELRALRQEHADTCAVLHDRLEAIRARLVEARDHLQSLDGRLVTANEHLDVIETNTTPAGPGVAEVVAVEGVDPEQLGQDAELAINDLNATLWWLGGLLVALFAGYQILRQVLPR